MSTFALAIFAVILVVAAVVAWRYRQPGRPIPAVLRPGQPLPDFSASDEDGNPVRSTQLHGTATVMLFVRGNWCPFCTSQVENLTVHYKVRRMVHAAGQLGDAERGRVRRENGVFPHPLLEKSEQAALDIHRFWSRFDDQLGSLHGKSQVGASLDAVQNLIPFRFGEFPRGDGLIEILSDQFEPGVDGAEVYVIQDGVDAGQGAHVCDPVSHGTRSEDRHTLKVYSQSGLRS